MLQTSDQSKACMVRYSLVLPALSAAGLSQKQSEAARILAASKQSEAARLTMGSMCQGQGSLQQVEQQGAFNRVSKVGVDQQLLHRAHVDPVCRPAGSTPGRCRAQCRTPIHCMLGPQKLMMLESQGTSISASKQMVA